jgi:hypothetical protein
MSATAGVWVAALLTLMVYSYLVDYDNPFWLLAEHIYMALAFGYSVAYAWQTSIAPALLGSPKSPGVVSGAWWYVIPMLVGLLIYARYIPALRWVARYPMSLWLGYGAGMVVANVPKTFLGQVIGSFYPLWGSKPLSTYLNGWILLLTLLGTLMYFFFTVDRERPLIKAGSWLGRWTIMVALGASFASTLLFRWTLAFGRFQFLLHDWLHVTGG